MPAHRVTSEFLLPRRFTDLFDRLHEIPLGEILADEELWAEVTEVFGEWDEDEEEFVPGDWLEEAYVAAGLDWESAGSVPENPVTGKLGDVDFRVHAGMTGVEQDGWGDDDFLVLQFELALQVEDDGPLGHAFKSINFDHGEVAWQEWDSENAEQHNLPSDSWQKLEWRDIDTEVEYAIVVKTF